MTKKEHSNGENRLVAKLPQGGQRRFLASCEQVKLGFADVVVDAGEHVRHVYFPLDSVISLVTTLADGQRLEVGIVGNEGMLGTSVILGVNVSPQLAVVQGSGWALRMGSTAFRRQYQQSTELRQVLNRYLYVLMMQLAQTAACTRYHMVETRLARWLLMTRDRAHCDHFHLTHEFLAYMLGVRRAGVTQAARSLHVQGLIEYSRGDITILDQAGLEEASCGCYRQGNEMYDRTLSSLRAA